jgi:hypothetical protein
LTFRPTFGLNRLLNTGSFHTIAKWHVETDEDSLGYFDGTLPAQHDSLAVPLVLQHNRLLGQDSEANLFHLKVPVHEDVTTSIHLCFSRHGAMNTT